MVAFLVTLLAGCGSGQDADVEEAAATFESAVTDQDAGSACAILAPRTRQELEQSSGQSCASAFLSEEVPEAGPLRGVDVFGTMAMARFRSDTLFLARFDGTWKVMAAHCSPKVGSPYECMVKGG